MWASVTAVKTLLKIKHADGFELNGVRALQRCVQVDRGEDSSKFRHTDPVSLRSLSLVMDLTMKKGVGLPCTN